MRQYLRVRLIQAAVLVCLCSALVGWAPSAPAGAGLHVGRLTLHGCRQGAWCGRLPRPLDPQGSVAGTVAIYFEYYPHSGAGPAKGTLVATEGGPGYPATDSRADYLALFAPLRAEHDVLIMDNRGTGRSDALDCPHLQRARQISEEDIGECGRALGSRAWLYTTAFAADDLAALLDELGIARIDLYGDSYGTYFAQVFARRHPGQVRSLVLDGADPLGGADLPWYPHYAPAMRNKFNLACERDAECRRLGGSSMDHIAPALRLLRERPIAAEVRYRHDARMHLIANASRLAIVMFGGAPDYITVREVDAAARAFAADDRLPLLRLMAETLAEVDSRDATRSPAYFSEALAATVSCLDPPQIFDMSLDPPERRAARDRAIARRKLEAPDTYAPFTIDEYRGMPLDYAFIDQCVDWPAPPRGAPSPPLIPAAGPYPDVPVLVISGELDNMTSVADGNDVAAHFPRAHHLVVANSFHVNAKPESRSDCAMVVVRRFLADLAPGDERCAGEVPPVPLVPRFARHFSELPPAEALAGNRAGKAELSAVTAALLACADTISRVRHYGSGSGLGLRGGDFTAMRAEAGGYRIALREVRWTEDLALSGRIGWPGRTGTVHARLSLRGPQRFSGTLALEWPEAASRARATVQGELNAQPVRAAAPAP